MSMFESAQRISAMNSNLYYGEVNMQRNLQQNSLQAPQRTSSSYDSPSDFYYGFGSMIRIPSPDSQNIEGVGDSAGVNSDHDEDSGQSTPNPALTPTLNSFSKFDPRGATASVPVPEAFDIYSEQIEDPSRAQYSPYILPPSPPSHAASFSFDKIAFKIDLEELKARMKETKLDMNQDNSDESASRSFLGDKVEHEFSFPRTSSSHDVTTRAHPRTCNSRATPSRRPEDPYISSSSSSTRRVRRSRTPKDYDRLGSHLSGDASESTPASSRESRDSRDDRLLSARSNTITSRRTGERGSRRELPSRRGCLL